jgi:hypothetical protein
MSNRAEKLRFRSHSDEDNAMSQTCNNSHILSVLAGVSLMFVFSAAAVTAVTAAEEGQPADLTEGSEKGPPADLKSAPTGAAEREKRERELRAAAPRAVSNWSPFTSEEFPPLTASNGQLISAMQCTGNYCDNVSLGYENVPGLNHLSNGWTSYFSEEGTYWRTCGGNSFMTGISCQGNNCDNVSLQCTVVAGKSRGSCQWMPWFSEEAQYSYLPQGSYAAGLACRGSNCDDLSILACRAN